MSSPAPTLLHVAVYGARAGELRRAGGTYTFAYDEAYRRRPSATPLSLSMPLNQAVHRGPGVEAFLWGLLPDNRDVLVRWGRMFAVSPKSPVALLAHVGQEIAGAAQFYPPDADLESTPGKLLAVDERWIEGRLNELGDDSAAWTPEDGHGMFSLAGAQPKMALRYDGTSWSLPDGSEPTTHILKPAVPGLLDHDINEHLCLAAAAGAKILAARSQVMRFGAQRAIVVSRYDRRLGSDGRVTRVHQEDLCQALGVHPDDKYQRDGGPGVEAVLGLLRRLDPVGDRALATRFLDGLALNWILAGADAHAKNYSLLLAGHDLRFAPLYDVASALPYPQMDMHRVRSAMKIGGSYDLAWITGANWRRLAADNRLDGDQLVSRVARLCIDVPTALAHAAQDPELAALGSAMPERMAEAVDKRSAECLSRLSDTVAVT